jgi:hypothetical protein
MKTSEAIILLLAFIINFIIISCSEEANPLESESFNEYIEIVTDKSEYSIDSVSSSRFIVITGILTNTSTDTLYSELGDGFNASFEQEPLLFAKGNDGIVEYYNKENKWVSIEQARLIEGSKVIRISPKSSYSFQAPAFIGINQTGQYRLIVKYYKSYNEINTDTLIDKSNTFTIY